MSVVRTPSTRLNKLSLLLLAASACSGQVGGEMTGSPDPNNPNPGVMTGTAGKGGTVTNPPSTPGAPVGPVTGVPPGDDKPIMAPATDTATTVGGFFVQRLTREEYNNTVRDLLGDKDGVGKGWPSDTNGNSGFASPGQVGNQEVSNYEIAARALSAKFKANDIAACTASDATCVKTFIEKFGPRAFRRPVDADDVTTFTAVYTALRGGMLNLDHADAMQGVLEAVLQSPRFLYRFEDGVADKADATGLRPLKPYALASRLSYFLWKTMPDEALFAAAKNGELLDESKLAGQVARMLKDKRAEDTVNDFSRQWMQLSRLDLISKDPTAYPTWTIAMRDMMKTELASFTKEAVLGTGTLSALLTGTKTMVNGPLAKLLGVEGVTGDAFVPATLDPTKRSGVLTTSAFLTVNASPYGSSPIKRGHVIRERFLCQPLSPAAGVDTTPPPDKPGQTTRETVDNATMKAGDGCASCHALMNPLGYGLENFDGVAQYRAKEKDRDIDATGKIAGTAKEAAFSNAPTLGKALMESEEVQKCIATQWARFGLGRQETAADSASMNFITAHFRASGGGFESLLTAVVRSRSFRYQGAQ